MMQSRPGSSPDGELPNTGLDAVLRDLADTINLRLLMLDDGSGSVRRRFIAALLANSRRLANKRVTLRAQKFVAQRGLCSDCNASLDARRLRPGTVANEPLRCTACMRRPRPAEVTSGGE